VEDCKLIKILLLGASGNLGAAIKSELENRGLTFICAGRPDFSILQPFSIESIINSCSPDYVVNCISINGIASCFGDKSSAMSVNGLFPLALASLSLLYDYTLVHFSTECVFSDSEETISSDILPPVPSTFYGISKLHGETRSICDSKSILIRLPLLLSFRPNSQIVWRLLRKIQLGEQCSASCDVYSTPIYVEHLAEQVVTSIENRIWPSRIIHASSDVRVSLYDTVVNEAKRLGMRSLNIAKGFDADYISPETKPRLLGLKASCSRFFFKMPYY
jgi:dTDP-4-dehydrorhamnose reductase